MPETKRILIISDIHYAGPAEIARGCLDHQVVENPLLRWTVRAYRRYIWRKDPFAHNHLLDRVVSKSDSPDYIVGNGDFSCDTAFVGVSDPAALESAEICLGKLRSKYGSRFYATIGDHELGKMSLFGACGGMRLASWRCTVDHLGIHPFWKAELGSYVMLGVTSSLIALPVYEPESLPEERPRWHELRREHFEQIHDALGSLSRHQRVILFCHDPTALPFLWRDPLVQAKLPQFTRTIIGHLHSRFFLWNSRMLAGMPALRFLGNAIRRMTVALREARHWKPFRPLLCPSLAGIQLFKDGGYYELELDPDGNRELKFNFRQLTWDSTQRKPRTC